MLPKPEVPLWDAEIQEIKFRHSESMSVTYPVIQHSDNNYKSLEIAWRDCVAKILVTTTPFPSSEEFTIEIIGINLRPFSIVEIQGD